MQSKYITYLTGITFLLFIFLNLISSESFSKSPEITLHSTTKFGNNKSRTIAASCGFTTNLRSSNVTLPDTSTTTMGHADEFIDCSFTCPDGSTLPGKNQCGLGCQPNAGSACTDPFCTNGITPNANYLNYRTILNGVSMYNNGSAPTPNYSLPSCPTTLPANHSRICEIFRTSSDGTNNGSWSENYDVNRTTWINQSVKTYPYSETFQVRCGYRNNNTGNYIKQSPWVVINASVLHPNYGLPCSATDPCQVTTNGMYNENGVCSAIVTNYPNCTNQNVCGQTFLGIQCPSGCTASTMTNNTCISNFTVSSGNVAPNSSVEFTWDVESTTSRPVCSFVDLTTPTPRLIPGLDNLSPTDDRVRITNIQTTTRFCLVCKFYSLLNNSYLGEAQVHQWVRVQRIGEN